MDDNNEGSVLSPTTSLLCHESINENPEAEQLQDPTFLDEFNSDITKSQTEQEENIDYVPTLFARENSYQFGSPKTDMSESDNAWIQSARLNSIQWFMQSRVSLGFQHRTVYLSIMYFDRFLQLQWKTMQRKEWMMRLLVLTCLSLAAKMEEAKVPKLSAYGCGNADFSFETKWIKRMEFRVLNVLQWELRFISPFCFIECFIKNLFQPEFPSEKTVSKAALIIFQAAAETSTMDYKPSVMAMAATLLVMDESLTKVEMEAKISKSEVSSYGFAATSEQVYSCYEMLKKSVVNDRAVSLSKSPGSSRVSTKRRRLDSDGCD